MPAASPSLLPRQNGPARIRCQLARLPKVIAGRFALPVKPGHVPEQEQKVRVLGLLFVGADQLIAAINSAIEVDLTGQVFDMPTSCAAWASERSWALVWK